MIDVSFKIVNPKKGRPKIDKTIREAVAVLRDNDTSKNCVAKLIVDDKEILIPFSSKSYDTKGKTSIFSKFKDKNGKTIRIIRDNIYATQFSESNDHYTPIQKGYVYSGQIVELNNTKYFDIIECLHKE